MYSVADFLKKLQNFATLQCNVQPAQPARIQDLAALPVLLRRIQEAERENHSIINVLRSGARRNFLGGPRPSSDIDIRKASMGQLLRHSAAGFFFAALSRRSVLFPLVFSSFASGHPVDRSPEHPREAPHVRISRYTTCRKPSQSLRGPNAQTQKQRTCQFVFSVNSLQLYTV
jgi:hypothetical protein